MNISCIGFFFGFIGVLAEVAYFFWYWNQIIVFQFGLGANAHYVILELYAQGNIILTDSEYMIMTLLRSHRLASISIPFIKSFVCAREKLN